MDKRSSALLARPAIGAVLLFGLWAATGCTKPEDDLGLDLLDPADTLGLRVVDTTSILAWTRVPEAFGTTGLSLNLLGSYVDERFGKVTASITAQVALSANNVGPASSTLVCDSLMLSFVYYDTDAAYGDLDPQVIRVYRVTEDLAADSAYTNDFAVQHDATDLVDGAPRSFTPDTLNGPVVDGDTVVPQLRIPLSLALGQELLGLWGSAELADNASFQAYFKGLYITPDNPGQAVNDGGVWYFNLRDGSSKLTLYYHDSSVGTPQFFDFVFNTTSVRHTRSEFDRAQATDTRLNAALLDSTLGQQEVYVQCLGGLRSELRFPSLDDFSDTELRALAKAELIVPLSETPYASYDPPAQLFVFRKDEDGADASVPDQITGQGVVGGLYDASTRSYTFNLTRWVQGVINGTYANTGLGLVAGSSGVSANRATLSGPSAATGPMKLRLTFTTY